MDYDSFFSELANKRKPSVLRQLFDETPPDQIQCHMAGGLPNEETFPFKSATIKLRDGSEIEIDEATMSAGMQYSITSGNPELRQWILELTRMLHDPPTLRDPSHPGKLDVKLCNGAQDCDYKLAETLAGRGDTILMEEHVYAGFQAAVKGTDARLMTVNSDKDGMIPEDLERILQAWPRKGETTPSNKSKLKFLYCIPNGGNPSGAKYTLERKQAIYRLAQEYDFLIVEDDAYYFLEEKPFTPSFLALDVDGRVIRIETFSKTIAPGLRIGVMLGPSPLLDRIKVALQSSTFGCSGVTQMMLMGLLRKLGHEGYLRHCEENASFYGQRRKACVELAEKYLTGIADWSTPSGGMFMWLKFRDFTDTFEFVMRDLLKRGVAIVAGAAFRTSDLDPSPFVRIAFSNASVEEMEQGFKIIAEEYARWKEVQQNKAA